MFNISYDVIIGAKYKHETESFSLRPKRVNFKQKIGRRSLDLNTGGRHCKSLFTISTSTHQTA